MGSAQFSGEVAVYPPFNQQEVDFLLMLADTATGVDNQLPDGQPGLWCQWVPTYGGEGLEWDGREKFYNSSDWMQYLIDHFIGDDPIAKKVNPEEFGFLQGHVVQGTIEAYGEAPADHWFLIVENNQVRTMVPMGANARPGN